MKNLKTVEEIFKELNACFYCLNTCTRNVLHKTPCKKHVKKYSLKFLGLALYRKNPINGWYDMLPNFRQPK